MDENTNNSQTEEKTPARSNASAFCEKYLLMRACTLDASLSQDNALAAAISIWNQTCSIQDVEEREFYKTYVLSRAACVNSDFDADAALQRARSIWRKLQWAKHPSKSVEEYVERHVNARRLAYDDVDDSQATGAAYKLWQRFTSF